jgi:hypothetical protein
MTLIFRELGRFLRSAHINDDAKIKSLAEPTCLRGDPDTLNDAGQPYLHFTAPLLLQGLFKLPLPSFHTSVLSLTVNIQTVLTLEDSRHQILQT